MDSIQWLQAWYRAKCNDDWEHQYGITIQTLDNPGWTVTIDLVGTSQENRQMREVGDSSNINHVGLEGSHDWLHCMVERNRFVGAGGPTSLVPICDVFRKWVEEGD